MNRDRPILLPGSPSGDEPPTEPPPEQTIDLDDSLPLAKPKMWTRGFLILCAAATFIQYLLVQEASQILEGALPWAVWLVPVAVLIVLLIGRRLLMPSSPRVIYFGDDAAELPKGRNSRRTWTLPYDKIRTIVPLVSRGQPALVIAGPQRTQVYIASDFPHAELWRVLWAQLVDRIDRRPESARRLREIRDLAQLSQETTSIKGRFTKRLFWVIAAVFAAQVFLGPAVDILEFLYFGANSQIMVLQEHQWWRVVTANLLHGNGVHFAVNAFALYFLGTYCERLFGEARTVLLTLGTALAGAMASLLGAAALFAVGISTALFGLLGAYFALHIRYGSQLPPPYRQSRRWWIVILGLNAVLSVAVPVIDAWGHFGGFVAGVAIAWAMTAGQKTFNPRRPSGKFTNVVAASLVALFAACSFIAIGYATGDRSDDEVILAGALLERADQEEPALLAQIGHEWAQHTPRPAEIDPILVSLAESAHERSDDIFTQWRAAATIIRLAEEMDEPFDRDVMQRGIVRFEQIGWQHDDRDARSATARMIVEFFNHVGPLRAAEAPFEEATRMDDGVALKPAGPLEGPRRVYVITVDHSGDERVPRHVLHRCVEPADDAGAKPWPLEGSAAASWTFELAMIVEAPRCTEAELNHWRMIALD